MTFPCCGYDIANTLDHSGLFTDFTSGITDFDVYLATNPIHSSILTHEWFSNAPTAAVTYDLGAIVLINVLALWNEEFSGIGAFDFSVSTNNVDFAVVLAGAMPVDSPAGLNYGAERFDFGIQSARYVRMELSGCPQPDGNPNFDVCGIGEVAFRQVPEPATVALLALGLAGFGWRRSMEG